jgi:hypothetical protein
LKSFSFSEYCFVEFGRRNNSPGQRNHFRLWRRTLETPHGYQAGVTTAADSVGDQTGDGQMRTLSLLLAFAFVLAGPSIAGSTDNSPPGAGTFAYAGSPVASSATQSILVAAR